MGLSRFFLITLFLFSKMNEHHSLTFISYRNIIFIEEVLEMKDAKEKSVSAFNRQSKTYDRDIKGEHARKLYPKLLNVLSTINYSSALDLGCGTGEVMKLILDADPSKLLNGIDLSDHMLEMAKRKLGDRVKLTLGDSEDLPFDDETFDLVYCNDSFHHYPNPIKVFSEVARVLRSGGCFLICDTWLPLVGRVIMNTFMPLSGEGDVRMYSEDEYRDLFYNDFKDFSWKDLHDNSCMALGVKK